MKQAEKKTRLTRKAWLQQALDILAEDSAHLRIDELAERLGVSKGSFYWHFENRSDFVRQLAEYWKDANTLAVKDAVDSVDGPAEDRLHALMKFLIEQQSGRYDLAVRAWARHEPSIVPVIRETDEIRLNTVNSLFLEMGFDKVEAWVRARVFMACHSMEDALSNAPTRKEALDHLDARHAFFTRR